jgi:glyoxylase I family protein
VIHALREEKGFTACVSDLNVRLLGLGIVLATYRVRGQASDPAIVRESLRSSVWVRRSDRWQLPFHQGTRSAATDLERRAIGAVAQLRAVSTALFGT